MSAASYDAVVVGSGPNGLAAAITLTEAGRSVLVLEAAERPGGSVVSEALTLPGFRHDVWSAVYPAAAASPVFAAMPLADHGLRWIQPEYAYAHPLPDGRAVALAPELERTVESLEAMHPGDGRAWAAFARPYLDNFEGLRRTILSGFPPLQGPARLLAGLGPRGMLEFVRLFLMPATALGHELFQSSGSRAWLYGSAMHSDVPPTGSGSAIAAGYLNLLGHAVGWPSPEGGAERLTAALVAYLESLGGEVRTGARVVRVRVAGGRVRGAELEDGEALATGIVVGDVTPHGLLRLAGHALPERYATALGRFRYGPTTLKVDWALSGPIPWSAPEARRAGTLHVGGDEEELLASILAIDAGRMPDVPFLLCGQQSVHDPTRAPAGQHTAWAYTHGPVGVDLMPELDRHVDAVEAQVERFAPGFRDVILARHVQGPASLEAGNENLVGGDVGGGSYTLDQLVFRPVPSLAPYRTPIAGLYIGSASAFPGAAVHGVPGHAAARLALAEARVRRPLAALRRGPGGDGGSG